MVDDHTIYRASRSLHRSSLRFLVMSEVHFWCIHAWGKQTREMDTTWPIINAVSAFRRFLTRYFGICQFFLLPNVPLLAQHKTLLTTIINVALKECRFALQISKAFSLIEVIDRNGILTIQIKTKRLTYLWFGQGVVGYQFKHELTLGHVKVMSFVHSLFC